MTITVKTKQAFHDLKEDVIRLEGDEFQVTEERFNEINNKLPEFIQKVDEEPKDKKTQSGKKPKKVDADGEE